MHDKTAAPVDSVGTELLFENEAVRVWSMRLQPGESSPYHRHLLDYVFVYMTPSQLTLKGHPTDTGNTVDFEDGYVEYINVGDGIEHQIVNAGDIPHRQVIVELKPQRDSRAAGSHNGRRRSGHTD